VEAKGWADNRFSEGLRMAILSPKSCNIICGRAVDWAVPTMRKGAGVAFRRGICTIIFEIVGCSCGNRVVKGH